MAREQAFELSVGGQRVPGVLWTPDGASGPLATVLMGHGRGDDKYSFGLEQPARRWADGHGWAAVAIDAPGHGERRVASSGFGLNTPKPDPGQVREEWQATIELLIAQAVIDPLALGYWGFSMSAALGISLMASEPRIKCAVIGLTLASYYPATLAEAARVRCPLLFDLHTDDHRVPLGEARALFEAIGSQEKLLCAYPGDHGDFTAQEIHAGEAFLAARLA